MENFVRQLRAKITEKFLTLKLEDVLKNKDPNVIKAAKNIMNGNNDTVKCNEINKISTFLEDVGRT